jgi:hypothetical protein
MSGNRNVNYDRVQCGNVSDHLCDPVTIKFMAEVNNTEGKMGIYFSLQKLAEAFLDHCVMCHFLHKEVSGYNIFTHL